jgi:chromosomal replication initiation ATPase DnaA
MSSLERSADALMQCSRVVRVVAVHKGVARGQLLSPTRSRSAVASARQLAMYLCHVLLGLNLTEVGHYFGRDRTTVSHACAQIEDAREDRDIDAEIQALEDTINCWIADDGKVTVEEMHDAAL